MRAELVIDLADLSRRIGEARGREIAVYPALSQLAALWASFDVEVSAMHLITPARGDGSPSAAEMVFDAWWQTESIFLNNASFTVHRTTCATSDDGSEAVGLDGLVTATALSLSEQLSATTETDPNAGDAIVIIMSDSPNLSGSVIHARGVPVFIAGVTVAETSPANIRLTTDALALLKNRSAAADFAEVAPLSSTERLKTAMYDRSSDAATLPKGAESLVLFDPRHFEVAVEEQADLAARINRAVQTLGMGQNPHLVELPADRSESELIALLYRFANDYENLPIVIASTCASAIAAAADLGKYHLPNARRVQRLCLLNRPIHFDDTPYVSSTASSRVVIENRVTELLDETDSTVASHNGPTSTAAKQREETTAWRQHTQRRYVLLGAHGKEATPADAAGGHFLPIRISDCPDFTSRPPALRPGLVVEAVLSDDESEWIVVSDAIERRKRRRDENLTDEQIQAMRGGGTEPVDDTPEQPTGPFRFSGSQPPVAA